MRLPWGYLVGMLAMLLASCQPAAHAPTALPGLTQTITPESGTNPLPAALYFLSEDPTGIAALYRLSDVSQPASLVASAPGAASITDYDLSISTQRMAYLAGDQLYVQRLDGSPPILILEGDAATATPAFLERLAAPRWSPDGQVLAFAYHGIQLYRPATGELINILPDTSTDDSSPHAQTLYAPVSWSPDGTRLLVSVSLSQGIGLGILTLTVSAFELLPPDTGCCQAAWTNDGQDILIANPYPSMGLTGLWRYRLNGAELTPLITSPAEGASITLVGWPHQDASGIILAFYTHSVSADYEPLPVSLVSLSQDLPPQIIPLRAETFSPHEVLWASDGSLAAAVIPAPGAAAWSASGTIVLIPTADTLAVQAVANGYGLHWGP